MSVFDGLLVLAGAISSDGALSGAPVTAIGANQFSNVVSLLGCTIAVANESPQLSDQFVGGGLIVSFTVMQGFASAGPATVGFQLVQADDPSLLTNPQVIACVPARAYGQLPAKTKFSLSLPPLEPYTPKPFVGLQAVVAGAALTAGSVFASLGRSREPSTTNRLYRSGYTV